jgi:hypothetical protein
MVFPLYEVCFGVLAVGCNLGDAFGTRGDALVLLRCCQEPLFASNGILADRQKIYKVVLGCS